jgi:citrate lyase beta subunit
MIQKAVASRADAVLIDLEDAVASAAKVQSRANVVRAIRELDWGKKPTTFRINALDTLFWYRDVLEIVEEAGDTLDLIIVPKVGSARDLAAMDALLTGIEANRGFERGSIHLEAQIETAQGLVNVDSIAMASNRLEALHWGPGDYAASMRMPATSIGAMDEWDALYPGHRFHYAMQRLVTSARAAGLRVLDGPLADFRDLEAYRTSCLLARSLGFDGKWCIHPAQIDTANQVFSPTERELVWAQKVLEAYAEAAKSGRGAISVDGTMVDGASIRMAQTTLDLAHLARLLGAEEKPPE